jgi:hypothetical protein
MRGKSHPMETETDRLQDTVIRAIGEAHVENLLDDLERNHGLIEKIELSEATKRSAEIFFEKDRRKRKGSTIHRFNKNRAAIFLLVLLGVFSITSLSVKAIRTKVFDYVVKVSDTFTKFSLTDVSPSSDPEINAKTEYYYPTKIPAGFTLMEKYDTGDIITLIYTKGNERFSFTQTPSYADYQLDTEDAMVEKIYVGEYEGFLITKKNKTKIFWHNDSSMFLLDGHVDPETLLKVANSVVKKP